MVAPERLPIGRGHDRLAVRFATHEGPRRGACREADALRAPAGFVVGIEDDHTGGRDEAEADGVEPEDRSVGGENESVTRGGKEEVAPGGARRGVLSERDRDGRECRIERTLAIGAEEGERAVAVSATEDPEAVRVGKDVERHGGPIGTGRIVDLAKGCGIDNDELAALENAVRNAQEEVVLEFEKWGGGELGGEGFKVGTRNQRPVGLEHQCGLRVSHELSLLDGVARLSNDQEAAVGEGEEMLQKGIAPDPQRGLEERIESTVGPEPGKPGAGAAVEGCEIACEEQSTLGSELGPVDHSGRGEIGSEGIEQRAGRTSSPEARQSEPEDQGEGGREEQWTTGNHGYYS